MKNLLIAVAAVGVAYLVYNEVKKNAKKKNGGCGCGDKKTPSASETAVSNAQLSLSTPITPSLAQTLAGDPILSGTLVQFNDSEKATVAPAKTEITE